MTTYMVGYEGRLLTLDQLNTRSDWQLLDPEFRRRLLAMFDASAGKVGIGGGGRTSAQQKALFLSRHVVDPTGPIFYDGRRWRRKPNVASAAPPGLSYHEETTPQGKALAADLIGDIGWAGREGHKFGLYDFSDVNSEPWHFQPVETPTSRSRYNGMPLPTFPIAGTPPPPIPPPISGGKFMHATVREGDVNADVYGLQVVLRRGAGQSEVTVSGTFDAATKQALRNVQSVNGLVADGICGPVSWAKLDIIANQ